jgi:hypothetical protein
MSMRTIIIIQTIIILAGAYYVYQLSQPKEMPASPTLEATTTPAFLEGYTPPTENPPPFENVATTTQESDITGHSDVGMEYPIMDGELEVR